MIEIVGCFFGVVLAINGHKVLCPSIVVDHLKADRIIFCPYL